MKTAVTISSPPTLGLGSAPARSWQRQLANYYQNYTLIGMILAESVGLPTQLIIQYRNLQQQMVAVLEQLLAENEGENWAPFDSALMTKFYQRHTRLLQHINKRATCLLKASHHE